MNTRSCGVGHWWVLVSLALACVVPSAWAAKSQDPGSGVVESSGAFTSDLPIDVPPYRGLEPRVTLSYQSSGANGEVGVGWSLGASSVIERRGPRGSVPSYVAGDTYYLDGQELITCTALGGTHCTKRQSYLRVTYESGPNRWVVVDRDGSVGIYTVLLTTESGVVRWALTSRTDVTGVNTVAYAYTCDAEETCTTTNTCDPCGVECYQNGSYQEGYWVCDPYYQAYCQCDIYGWCVLSEPSGCSTENCDFSCYQTTCSTSAYAYECYLDTITYNGAEVRFYRESRPDEIIASRNAPTLGRMRQRLRSVVVKQNGTLLSAHVLAYATSTATGRSLLTAAQPYGTDAVIVNGYVTGGTAGPQTTISWQGSGDSGGTPYTVATSLSNAAGANGADNYPTIAYPDINGDGKSDLCYRADNGYFCAIADGLGGFGTPTLANYMLANNVSGVYGGNNDDDNYPTIRHPDLNGDGKADLCWRGDTGWWCAQSSGTTFDNQSVRLTNLANSVSSTQGGNNDYDNLQAIATPDINSDGKPDVCWRGDQGLWCATGTGSGTYTNPQTYIGAVGNGLGVDLDSLVYGDLNGDRRIDLCWRDAPYLLCAMANEVGGYSNTPIQALSMTGSYGGNWDFNNLPTIRLPDINGDGVADVCWRADTGLFCGLGRGNGTFFSAQLVLSQLADSSADQDNWPTIRFADMNADGRADVCWRSDTAYMCARSRGDGTFLTPTVFSSGPSNANGFTAADQYRTVEIPDITGDGIPDLCYRRSTGLSCLRNTATPELVSGVQNGVGGSIYVTYAMSSKWPSTNNPPVSPTVESIMTHYGQGVSTTSYTYAGGLWDPLEANFLGFATVKTFLPCAAGETAPCSYVETSFIQDYGVFGRPSQVVARRGDGSMMLAEQYTYQHNGASTPYESLETSRTITDYDVTNNASYKRSYVSRTYDSYGNVLTETDWGNADASGDERIRQYTYRPNTTKYLVSYPARVSQYLGSSTGGTLLNDVLIHYDSNSTWDASPTAGRVKANYRWVSSALGYVSAQYTYDPWGNIVTEIDALGHTTTIAYDTTMRIMPTSVTNAAGMTKTTAYHAGCLKPSVSTNERGQQTSITYDALCRVTRVDQPGGQYETTTYGIDGPLSTVYTEVRENAANATDGEIWTKHRFDGLGRVWRTETRGAGSAIVYIDTVLDAQGNESGESRPYFGGGSVYWVQKTYDGLGRPKVVTQPDGATVTFSYVPWQVTITNESGGQERRTLDAYAQTIEVAERVGATWRPATYTYNLRGEVTGISDAAGNTWQMTYDALGRKTAMADPDLGAWTYTYDARGGLTQVRDAKNQQTDFVYDVLGRETQRTTKLASGAVERTVTRSYDQARAGYSNLGLPTGMSDPSGTVTYDHDSAGRLARLVRTVDGTSYEFTRTYDAGGRPLTTTAKRNGATVSSSGTLGYDGAGRLVSVPGYVTSATYDAEDNLLSIQNANGTTTTRTYSATRGWVTGIGTTKSATTIQNLSYTRDLRGYVSSVAGISANESWSYGYDALGQLLTATNTNDASKNQTFTYDTIGNLTSQTGVGSYSYPATGAARPHAVSAAGANSYAYDANGNTTSGGGRTYTWSVENKPLTVGSESYTYDGDGNRLKITSGGVTTVTIGDDFIDVNGTVTQYVTFSGFLIAKSVGGTKFWLHSDALGSTQAITDAAGTVVQRFGYGPTTTLLSSQTAHAEARRVAGQRQDGTGLYFLHARFYDPVLGRFISPDPNMPKDAGVGLNRYAYAANNPVSLADIDGLGNFWRTLGRIVLSLLGDIIAPVKFVKNWVRYGFWSALGILVVDIVFNFIKNAVAAIPYVGWVAFAAIVVLMVVIDVAKSFVVGLLEGDTAKEAISSAVGSEKSGWGVVGRMALLVVTNALAKISYDTGNGVDSKPAKWFSKYRDKFASTVALWGGKSKIFKWAFGMISREICGLGKPEAWTRGNSIWSTALKRSIFKLRETWDVAAITHAFSLYSWRFGNYTNAAGMMIGTVLYIHGIVPITGGTVEPLTPRRRSKITIGRVISEIWDALF